eukprot:m.112116 g.112116  ORF g.112116 m.112116 type:complete len:244 (-) comp15968_c1_seq8:85-816(-)
MDVSSGIGHVLPNQKAFLETLTTDLNQELARIGRDRLRSEDECRMLAMRAHGSALDEFIERFPMYGGILSAVKREYDLVISSELEGQSRASLHRSRVEAAVNYRANISQYGKVEADILDKLQKLQREQRAAKARLRWSFVAKEMRRLWLARQAEHTRREVERQRARRRELVLELGSARAVSKPLLEQELSALLTQLETLTSDVTVVPQIQVLHVRQSLRELEDKLSARRRIPAGCRCGKRPGV